MTALAAEVNAGDTAWMLVATALVLLMTPALGLFYAGLVRGKNTLNTFMMSVGAIAVAALTWALLGYSLAFADGNVSGHVLPSVAPGGVRVASSRRRRSSAAPPSGATCTAAAPQSSASSAG